MGRTRAQDFGIGCRFSVFPLCDDYGTVILDALAGVRAADLELVTDDVSTFLGGEEEPILRAVRDVLLGCARRTGHVMATMLLSRGCPGERCQASTGGDAPAPPAAPRLEPSGLRAAAHWSLYPLGTADHMDLISAAVEQARRAGTFARSEHYATRLEADLSDVLATVAGGWLAAGAAVPHVVTHATLSLGAPAVAR